MSVSVIMNSYNRPNWVQDAINSVLAQSYTDWVLYVMDDASNQETQDILREYEKKDSRIRFFITDPPPAPEERHQTVRYAICINKALQMVDSDYITYLTDDCWFLPDRLLVMSQYLDEHPDVNTCYGIQGLAYAPNWNVVHNRGPFGITPSNTHPGPQCHVDHNSIMHRCGVLEKVPQWSTDPGLIGMADGAFFVEVVKHCGPFYPVNVMTDVNRLHGRSLCSILRGGQQNVYLDPNVSLES